MWGASRRRRACCRGLQSFKSCPRVGGIRGDDRQQAGNDAVSSRAPVWGASCWKRCWKSSAPRFQVVPPCGGHRLCTGSRRRRGRFQVVPPCGGHLEQADDRGQQGLVSSRAPVWGASSCRPRDTCHNCFKSCPRVGGIRLILRPASPYTSFKSCPRVGGIRRSCRSSLETARFKSCPRVGGIRQDRQLRRRRDRFKSCPRVGGILPRDGSMLPARLFQVVPPCGGHPELSTAGIIFMEVSSRAPVWGASAQPPRNSQRPRVSSRAPVWGASWRCHARAAARRFQVVPPCGGHPPPR